MKSNKEYTNISKFLSLVLRHQPEIISIRLDQNGWAVVNELIDKANNYGIRLERNT